MATSRTETAPGTWDDARDASFFRITARLFSPQFCLGATVLLASYDDDDETTPAQPSWEPSRYWSAQAPMMRAARLA